MFADYVVPAVLRHWGILTCSQALVKMVDSLQELPSGSEEEVELRACTITAVERLREYLAARTGTEVGIATSHRDFFMFGHVVYLLPHCSV